MSKYESYFDVQWLQMNNGLSLNNAIEYFYSSPFYKKECNNEIIRYLPNTTNSLTGNDSYISKLKTMKGLEFVVDENIHNIPHLFIIKQQYRKSYDVTELIECK